MAVTLLIKEWMTFQGVDSNVQSLESHWSEKRTD